MVKVISLVHYTCLPEEIIPAYLIHKFDHPAQLQGIDHLVIINDPEAFYQPFKLQSALYTIQQLAIKYKIDKITCISDTSNRKNIPNNIKNIEFVFVEVWMLLVYLYNLSNIDINQQWNADVNNFLFLTGDLNRMNRVIALKKCYEQGLLTTNNKWSFPLVDSTATAEFLISNHEDNLDITGFFDYCKTYSVANKNNLFIQKIKPMKNMLMSNSWFNETSYSIVSEHSFEINIEFITEKTYRCFLNRHPFIMLGWPGILKKLKKIGFKTFDNYLKIPYYDTIVDPSERLLAIIENIRHFDEAKVNNISQINDDIEKNYTLFMELSKNQVSTIENVLAPYQFSPDILLTNFTESEDVAIFNFFKDVPQSPAEQLDEEFRSLYRNIKADVWPSECASITDFKLLPKYIQDECLGCGLSDMLERFKTAHKYY